MSDQVENKKRKREEQEINVLAKISAVKRRKSVLTTKLAHLGAMLRKAKDYKEGEIKYTVPGDPGSFIADHINSLEILKVCFDEDFRMICINPKLDYLEKLKLEAEKRGYIIVEGNSITGSDEEKG